MAVKAIRGPMLLNLHDQVLGKPRGGIDPNVKPVKGEPKYQPTAELLDTAGYDESPEEYTAGIPQTLRLINAILPGRTASVGTLLVHGHRLQEMASRGKSLTKEQESELKALKDLLSRVQAPGTALPPAEIALTRDQVIDQRYLATLSERTGDGDRLPESRGGSGRGLRGVALGPAFEPRVRFQPLTEFLPSRWPCLSHPRPPMCMFPAVPRW